MAKRTITRTCENCGTQFEVCPSVVKVGAGRFCSKLCKDVSRTKPQPIYSCAQCGEPIVLDSQRRAAIAKGAGRFCSQPCFAASRKRRITLSCMNCGISFNIHISTLERRDDAGKYCSPRCRYEANTYTLEERFKRHPKMQMPNGCLIWLGAKDPNGYGMIDSGPPDNRNIRAHRVAFVLAGGTLTSELDVLHHCDTPPCVAAPCLFSGTQMDNNRDKMNKGRQAKGEAQGGAKLTDEIVINARRRVERGESTCTREAQRAGVTASTMCSALKRRTWKHLP